MVGKFFGSRYPFHQNLLMAFAGFFLETFVGKKFIHLSLDIYIYAHMEL